MKNLIEKASKHYENLLGIYPKTTKIQKIEENVWDDFCNSLGLDTNCQGAYISRNSQAYIKNSKFAFLNIFHEYFGHGFYNEFTKSGKILRNLENKLKNKERRRFKKRKFSLEELNEFRKSNPIYNILKNARDQNIDFYENFAIWTEKYLSDIMGIKGFEEKYSNFPNVIEKINIIENYRKKSGDLALFYSLGFPKYYDKIKAKLIYDLIFKEPDNPKLVLLYGSKKPYSDIDFFSVSEKHQSLTNEWVDIHSINPKMFEYSLKVFDIAITDPILSGELIIGEKDYLALKQKQLMFQPITKEAIYYNIIKSKEQKILANSYPQDSEEYRRGNTYAKTYMKNALNLSRGIRKLTKKELWR